MTTAWFLAPPSACTRLPCATPVRCTWRATGVEPTKLTASMPSWARIASTISLSPCTTPNTPGGRPHSPSSSPSSRDGEGSRSDGLRMKQLPAASAIGAIQSGTMTGKLNGVMPAHTPSGWRIDQASTPRPACSV